MIRPYINWRKKHALSVETIIEILLWSGIVVAVAYSFNSSQLDASNLNIRLAEIGLAAVATGAVIKTGKRCERTIKSGFVSDARSSNDFCSLMWILWFGLAITAWAVAGQNIIWDFGHPMVTLNHFNSKTPPTPNNDQGAIFSGMTLIVTIVTGYYLLMLNQALDHARKSSVEIKDTLEKVKLLNAEVNKEKQHIENQADADIQLRKEILLPLLRLQMSTANSNVKQALKQKIDILHAEIDLFALHKVNSLEVFKHAWDEKNAYSTVYETHPELFRFHFERAQRTLKELCLHEPRQAESPEITKIRNDVQAWLNRYKS